MKHKLVAEEPKVLRRDEVEERVREAIERMVREMSQYDLRRYFGVEK